MAVAVEGTASGKKGTRVSLRMQVAGTLGTCRHLDDSTPAAFVPVLAPQNEDSKRTETERCGGREKRQRKSDWLSLGHIFTQGGEGASDSPR